MRPRRPTRIHHLVVLCLAGDWSRHPLVLHLALGDLKGQDSSFGYKHRFRGIK
jgi:hypothetical protein